MNVDTAPSTVDRLIWAAIVVLLSSGIVANVYFGEIASSIRIAVWIIIFLGLGLAALQTQQGKVFFEFIKEVKMELRKVVWPVRQQIIQTTGLVIVAVIIFAFVLWVMDSGLIYTVTKLTD